MNKLAALISILFYAMVAPAQTPVSLRYNFNNYAEETGLISYQINSTVQDDEGYIWIASNEGLQRFDGIRFKNFRPVANDSSTIPSKSILQLLFDNNKNLWLLTIEGRIGVFNTKTFEFKEADVQVINTDLLGSLSSSKRLITDAYGNIFLLLLGKELVTYSPRNNTFTASNNFFLPNPEWKIVDFVQQPDTKKYWMCIADMGFAVYDSANGQLSYHGKNSGQEKIIEQYQKETNPTKLFFDTHGRMWHVSVENELPMLYCFDLKKQQSILDKYGFVEAVPRYHEVHQFLEQQDGSIWISGIGILAKYLEAEKQFQQVRNGYEDDRSIDFNIITDLNEDKERNIWVGTGNNGLYRFNPSEEFFHTIDHSYKLTDNLGSGAPVTFMQDLDGSILVGVWQDSLYRYNADLRRIPLDIKGFPKGKTTPILSMCPSRKGQYIWMAAKNGLYKYDQKSRRVQYYHLPMLESRIRAMEEDHYGNLWLGLFDDGVYKWDPLKAGVDFSKGLSKFTPIPPSRINKIMVDREGIVWIGTASDGLYTVDPGTDDIIHHMHIKATPEFKLPEQGASALLDYNDSLVIIGTAKNVLLYNRIGQKLSVLGNSDVTSGFVQAMEKDAAGYVWLATTAAMYRVNVGNRFFLKFNRIDGIRNDYFILAASKVLRDGKMFFGASYSIVVFNPSDIKIESAYPKINITDFILMNRSLRLDSLLQQNQIEFAHHENSITIDLSTMSYNTIYKIRYKLEGLDTDWKIADRTHELVYPYLPPGSYRLLVKTMNTEGVEGRELALLNFAIGSPFWQTWWFYIAWALLIGLVLFWFDKARMQRKERLSKMRSDIAANLHEEVNTALGNINILSEMAKLKAEIDPKKSAEFIEQIHSRSHNMIIAMDDMLWSISPDNDSMEKTIARMEEYIDALNNRRSAGIAILVDKRVKSLKLDMQLRHEAFLLFKESIKELIQAGATQFKIHLTLDKSHLLYTMQFNNKDCDRQQLNQFLNRSDMVNKLFNMRAKLQVQEHKTNSVMELRIPL